MKRREYIKPTAKTLELEGPLMQIVIGSEHRTEAPAYRDDFDEEDWDNDSLDFAASLREGLL